MPVAACRIPADLPMAILVTGAAGFIGSNVVKALNLAGHNDIIACDNLSKAEKFLNLVDCEVVDYVDKTRLMDYLGGGGPGLVGGIEAVFHQGACSSTTESDGRYMMENNFRFSVELLEYCHLAGVPFLYASSAATYGAAANGFREERDCESPLNVYGFSKFLFDQHVRHRASELSVPVAGFRYFNVYGPRESHKGRMASVAFHNFNQFRAEGHVRLFEGSHGYGPGGQRRDFVHVEDVAAVNIWAWNAGARGIFNVGTGRAQEFNDIAVATVNTCREMEGESVLSREDMVDQGLLKYIEFPGDLKGKYQSFTQADLAKLRAAGCTQEFRSVEQGVSEYARLLWASQGG